MTSTDPPPTPPDAGLTLVTLGGAGLYRPDGEEAPRLVLGPGKPLALLVYLALGPGRSANREHLVDLLWSDAEPVAGDHAFRQTLWFIRHHVDRNLLRTDDGELALAAPLPSDHAEFLTAFERRDFEGAVVRYAGEFLPSFALPGGVEFEHWADAERYRLRSAFSRAAETVTRRWLRAGRSRDAVALARRLRDQALLDEGGWRLLLEALSSSGDSVAAVVEAERFEQLLRQENREPEPATRAAIRLARETPATRPEAPARAALVAELVGREHEFSALVAAWERARNGQSRHVHITAPAGLGKTRLLADLRARLRAIGGRVVSVRANPGERSVAYAFAGDLAAALAAVPGAAGVGPAAASVLVGLNPALSSLFAVGPEVGGHDETLRRRTFALGDLVRAVADEAPLACLVDDMHWADSPSRRLLAGALAKLENNRVLTVTTARPGPEGNLAVAGSEQLCLPPLSLPQVVAMVSSLGAIPSEPWASALAIELHAASRGSPLLALETLQHLLECGVLHRGRDGWTCLDPDALAADLRTGSALGRRIEQVASGPAALLLTLAVAGVPLRTETAARAAARAHTAVRAELDDLEQKGLVSRSDDRWVPAHDEIADLAVRTAGPEVAAATHASLGQALAESAEEDAVALAHAAQHLLAGGCAERLGPLFRSYIRQTRGSGDRRPFRTLATEFLGEGAAPEQVAALLATLPVHLRAGLTSPARVAALLAGLGLVVGSAAFALLRPPAPVPDAILVAQPWDSAGAPHILSAAITADSWDPAKDIGLGCDRTLATPPPPARAQGSSDDLVSSPDGARWAYSKAAGPGEERDIFVSDARGGERPLAPDPRGDRAPCWSPDGRRLAFSTERWNPHAWASLAVVDVATGAVRRLTHGNSTDGRCAWSPNGARIAFVRHASGEALPQPAMLCTVTADGRSPSCAEVSGLRPMSTLAWVGDGSVWIGGLDTAGQRRWGRVSLASGRVDLLDLPGALALQVSPGGQWIAAYGAEPGLVGPRWRVFPAGHPERSRLVAEPRGLAGELRLVWLASRQPPFLDRLRIRAPRQPLPATASTRLRVDGFASTGSAFPVPRDVTWSSSDTSVAMVGGHSGVLVPRRPGRVTVVADAGGWRADSLVLEIAPPPWRIAVAENWSGPLEDRWVPWGEPRPFISRSSKGAWLLPNGDSTYASGLYSRQRFDASAGLGVEVELSTPLTMLQWQYHFVQLTTRLDEVALHSWDHRSAEPPEGPSRTTPLCVALYPAGDGRAMLRQAALGSPAVDKLRHVPARYPAGRTWRVRIQYFPDGTCGFALDGRPVWRDTVGADADTPMRVLLAGKSVRTRIRVGRVEVWEGIREGVDWMALDRATTRVRPPATRPTPRQRPSPSATGQ